MPTGNVANVMHTEIGRRGFLGLTGTTVALLGCGYFQSAPAAAQARAGGTASGSAFGTAWASERVVTGGAAAAWDFADGAGGWQSSGGLSPLEVRDGMLHATVTGNDPWMVHNEVDDLTGFSDRVLRLRLRVTPGAGTQPDPQVRVYFDTHESPGFESIKTLTFSVTADGEFHEYQQDMSDKPLWRCGTVRRLRLDPEGMGAGTEITIDHIRIERQAYVDEHWFVEPLVSAGVAADITTFGAKTVDLDGSRDRILHARIRLVPPTGQFDPPPDPILTFHFETAESPGFSLVKDYRPHIPGDGEWHELFVDLGAENPLWRSGRITRIKMNAAPYQGDGARWELDFARIEKMAGPRLAVRPLTVDTGAAAPGDALALATAVVNVGADPSEEFTASMSLPDVLAAGGPLDVTVPALEPFAPPRELAWDATAEGDAPAAATLAWQLPGGTHHQGVVVPLVPAVGASSALEAWAATGTHADEVDGHVVLRNDKVRAVFARSESGFSQLRLAARDGDRWRDVATSQPLSWLLVGAADGTAELLPVVPTGHRFADDTLTLTGSVQDSSGTTWTTELDFGLRAAPTPHAVHVTYRVTPDRDAALLSFRGPSLTAGQGTFGAAKTAAMLPGVEWLEGDERSSSTLDIHPVQIIGHGSDLRATPHPLNVTVPLMTVASDDVVVSLLWDNTQAWDGTRRHPSPMFASPNWLDDQDNHLMSLFLPAADDGLPPMSPHPAAPYGVKARQTLTVTAQYAAAVAGDVLTAMDDWYALHGVPKPAEKPFSFADEVTLVRESYLDSYWDEDREAFHGVWQRGSGWNVLPAIALLIAGRTSGDAEIRQTVEDRVRRFVDRSLTELGPTGPSNVHAVNTAGWLHHGAFYLGHLEESLPAWKELSDGFLETQHDDGSWGFTKRKPQDEMLGRPGEFVLGRSARHAQHLLRYARLVGDAEAQAAGLRGIDFVNGYTVPRAAQEWEVAVHVPDVLAAAYAVYANGEAYRATGDREYVEKGLYWAKAALPFLYHWETDELPLLKYASKPVLGTSRFRNSWMFRPVQWNGLMYAAFLQDFLDAVRDPAGTTPFAPGWDAVDFPYRRVVEGLVVSAMHQQRLEEPARGGYPDNWWLLSNIPSRGIDLGSVRIANPLFMLGATGAGGRPVDAQTAVVGDARISTAADVRSASLTDTALTAELGFYAGADSQLLVTGLGTTSGVTVDGTELAEVAGSLDEAGTGWKQLADGTVLVALRHQDVSTLVVRR